tara:strand:+ start:522 stop:881 length:360 start_codon:yes stop_codon:yes gene_type:complete
MNNPKSIWELAKDSNGRIQQFIDVGKQWAMEDHKRRLLDDLKKVVKSEMQTPLLKEGKSLGQSEIYAYASKEYKEHLELLGKATLAANERQIELKALEMKEISQNSMNKLASKERGMYK